MADSEREPTGESDGLLSGAKARLVRSMRVITGSSIDVEDYDPVKHDPLATFDGLAGMDEIERYWLNAPYAFVSINHDPEENEHRYHVVEPTLDELETDLLERLFEDIRTPLLYRENIEDDPETALLEELEARTAS